MNCPQCDSANVMFSRKRKVHICEDCGHEFTVTKPTTELRIFLSYGHDDNEELVRRIKGDLEARGHDVWFDKSPEEGKGIRVADILVTPCGSRNGVLSFCHEYRR
ncbi:MAG: toll/interleukin-1 receptor domain-containing protein [Candidatus Hydrogenedentes bacterium]|nr:toll/interleukin-1 receptor domain-containing protein [Candidatus Hydrogenedentota bacterium]